MRTGNFKEDGRECVIYETFEEVCKLAVRPPRFCEICGEELTYCSFYDALNRFTLKAYCHKCKNNRAISVNKDKYEQKMLLHWSNLVKERAGYKCEMASAICEGNLHAHHIIPKHLDPSKKYDVTNGICICEKHHKLIHSYM